MPPATGYKVLFHCADGRLISPTALLPVEYKVREKTFPPKDWGPLSVFNTLEDAIIYGNKTYMRDSHLIIYYAYYHPSVYKTVWFIDKDGIRTEADERTFPHGTILTDFVGLDIPVQTWIIKKSIRRYNWLVIWHKLTSLFR